MILHKLYRKIFQIWEFVQNERRILHLKLKYPGIQFSGHNKVGKNCYITCTDESTLTLHNVALGNNVHIVASRGGSLSINNAFIGSGSVIVSIQSIVIEANTQIAEMVVIRDQDHKTSTSGTPISDLGYNSAPIHIKTNVWLAAKSTVLKGVTIGENAVVGAHSMVNSDVAPGAVVVGAPAKPIVHK